MGRIDAVSKTLLRLCVLCLFFVGYAAVPQNPKTRPHLVWFAGGNRPGLREEEAVTVRIRGAADTAGAPESWGGGNNRPQPAVPILAGETTALLPDLARERDHRSVRRTGRGLADRHSGTSTGESSFLRLAAE